RCLTLLRGLIGQIPLLVRLCPVSALASHSQVSVFEEGGVASTPAQVMQELRHQGSTEIRVVVHWSDLAPSPSSSRRPRFNAADPAAYPASKWAPFDNAVRQAQAKGVKAMLTVT